MKQAHAENIYRFFNHYIEDFLLKGNSILTDDKDILTEQTIKNWGQRYFLGSMIV